MKNESGFSVVIVVVAIFVIGAVGFSGYFVYKNNSNNNVSDEASLEQVEPLNSNDQQVAGAVEQADEPINDAQQAETTQTPAPEPAPIETQKPEPAPSVQKPKVTPITMSDCNGQRFTAYVANQNGAQGSYRSPGSWQAATKYSYQQSISVMCEVNGNYSPDYVIGNDDYIKSSDLSKTKP